MPRLKILLIITVTFFISRTTHAQNEPLFRNPNAPIEDKVTDLLHTLTLQEKISLLGNNSPAIERLGIPSYNWWNEGLHGMARAGEATVFPQAIGMAASFNDALLQEVAAAI